MVLLNPANGFIEITTWLTAAEWRMQMPGNKTRPDAVSRGYHTQEE
jgi:hypothetical protein